ncbi:lysM and putative peptidoglycan-binding domain-containing protein 1 [Brachionichthys hirsutus]|uniref:lysM and putative peptidoglycan-binding domain-containing protein 1 n=1 Tax=Brachionichthys hirsutus TaxID=412623 RepID=UPI0036049754
MSGERAALPPGEEGLLQGSRTRSYGSLVRSPVRQRRVEHEIQPGETLQGLALKYGVSMEQIKRANRMYTNDSIFLKTSLSIPVTSDSCRRGGGVDGDGKDSGGAPRQNGLSEEERGAVTERASDLSPADFMKRLDGRIGRSKQAAADGRQEAERRVAALEAACASGASRWRPLAGSRSVVASPGGQRTPHGDVPLTVTRLTGKLSDAEDEIFQL